MSGNFIGITADGTAHINFTGVLIDGASGNVVGNITPSERNIINASSFFGVYIVDGTANSVRGNSIYSSGKYGIVFVDASGPNKPVLVDAKVSMEGTLITGSLDSTASTTFALDFYSDTGQNYLGSTTVTTRGGHHQGSHNVDGHVDFAATLVGVRVHTGAAISATATDTGGTTSEFGNTISAVVFDPTGPSALVVTTAQDLVSQDGLISLREAINTANTNPGPDSITFAIPDDGSGSSVHVIQLESTLTLSDNGTTIDGYSQSGAQVNTLATDSNAVIKIRMNGTGAQGFNGLTINAAYCTVRGLSLTSFYAGIALIGDGAANNKVTGNILGLNADGTAPGPNSDGVLISIASGNTIGGATPGERNTIGGNTIGVYISGTTSRGNTVLGNTIGAFLGGTTTFANQDGITIAGGSLNTIGGTKAGEGNTLIGNTRNGVRITGTATTSASTTGNSVRGNFITANGALGIDLGGNGQSANDAGDADTGPNNLQNFPVLLRASSEGGLPLIQGTLNSTANTKFLLDFYANASKRYLGSATVTTDASGNAPFNAPLIGITLSTGTVVNATATDPGGNTSEFSQSVSAAPLPVLSVDSPLVIEGNSGTTPLVFTFSLSKPSSSPVSVTVNTTQDTAKSGSDYRSVPRSTITFSPGTTRQAFTVQVVGDTQVEADEGFRLDLSSPSGATLGTASGTGTIQNDDLPLVSVNSPALLEGNSGTTPLIFTLTLSQASPKSASVYVQSFQNTALGEKDYVTKGRTLVTFTPGQTTQNVSVLIKGDTQIESNEQFTLQLSSPTGALLGTSSGTGTIVNDDAPNVGASDINDFVDGRQNVTQKILASTLLANDYRALGRKTNGSLQLVSFKTPRNFEGTLKFTVIRAYPTFLTYIDKSTLIYTPRANWSGETQFEYTVLDKTTGETYSAQVFLTIVAPTSSKSPTTNSFSPSGGGS